MERLRVTIRGAVQGVGFRPYIFRLATGIGLSGWVNNSPGGVLVEVEGDREKLDSFLLRLDKEKPSAAFIQSLESSFLDPCGMHGFEIRPSSLSGEKTTLILPDIATCPDCLREIFDPSDRRFLYPFANCTNCGPRFTILESLPYDRPNISMRAFRMCAACRAEYENPADRRFHAQPIACPACGPAAALWDSDGGILAGTQEAVRQAAACLQSGMILAVKGLGGFHLLADAGNEVAVRILRERKQREEKPFALMFPSIEQIREECQISPLEERLLLSPEAPIVLLRRRAGAPDRIAPAVAPGNPYLGIMLPYTPLHHILMRTLSIPLVATSGNLSDEPICTDEIEALERLRGIADLFLVHNRPIVRHVDDSVVRLVLGRELVLRRARGYAPLPIPIPDSAPVLAVGGHLKNTSCLAAGAQAFITQHIGDLETSQATQAFQSAIRDFQRLYETVPERVVADLHPDYVSTRYAAELGLPLVQLQHHYAHVASCMAENELRGKVLGVAWDGTGYGPDGTVWGGEFLVADEKSFSRAAHFRQFRLPGGEKAVREPRRTALGLLFEIFGPGIGEMHDCAPVAAFNSRELALLTRMLERGVQSPQTSSAGRLFDAVAAITGLRQRISFEGQAAMELEFAADAFQSTETYPYGCSESSATAGVAIILDWEPMIRTILAETASGMAAGVISRRFHNTLAKMIRRMAERIGIERVVLSGGCFQNHILTELAFGQLQSAGFRPYWHQRVPPNDGGLSLGQAFAAARRGEISLGC